MKLDPSIHFYIVTRLMQLSLVADVNLRALPLPAKGENFDWSINMHSFGSWVNRITTLLSCSSFPQNQWLINRSIMHKYRLPIFSEGRLYNVCKTVPWKTTDHPISSYFRDCIHCRDSIYYCWQCFLDCRPRKGDGKKDDSSYHMPKESRKTQTVVLLLLMQPYH